MSTSDLRLPHKNQTGSKWRTSADNLPVFLQEFGVAAASSEASSSSEANQNDGASIRVQQCHLLVLALYCCTLALHNQAPCYTVALLPAASAPLMPTSC